MRVCLEVAEVRTYGPLKLFRIGGIVAEAVRRCGVKEGIARVDVAGATPAIVILDPGDEERFLELLTRLIPLAGWRHGNAYAHLISTALTTSVQVAIEGGELLLPPNHDIYLLETRPVHNHRRRISIEVVGEP